MDLNNILLQGTSQLSIRDLRALLSEKENATRLSRINNATFAYPTSVEESYEFFDVFIHLLLTIQPVDSAYGEDYANTVIVDALRLCINGLLKGHGLTWLLYFPLHFSAETWQALLANADKTILVYLYGLVLALAKKPGLSLDQWASGIVKFVRAGSSVIMSHLWINLWDLDLRMQTDTKSAYIGALQQFFKVGQLEKSVTDMFWIMSRSDVDCLVSGVDHQLGSALLRPSFNKDELTLALMAFEMEIQGREAICFDVSRAFKMFRHAEAVQNRVQPENVLSQNLLMVPPGDNASRAALLQTGFQSWIAQFASLFPFEFELYLKSLINQNYPAEKKTMLDLVLADWAVRDPYRLHMEMIVDAVVDLLERSRYNMRTAPFYAFIQLFNTSDEQTTQGEEAAAAYSVDTGAAVGFSGSDIDLDTSLAQGCCRILQKMAMRSATKTWAADCLRGASPGVVQSYVEWLVPQLNAELSGETRHSTRFTNCMRATLLNERIVALSSYVVPVLLKNFNDQSLKWLLRELNVARILVSYFNQGPQLQSQQLVKDLLQHKSKAYIDLILGFLRENMNDTNIDSETSRMWFRNHFLASILSIASSDSAGNSVSSQILRQILKTQGDFGWYFGAPCSKEATNAADFNALDLSKSHDILPVRTIGLASMLREIAQLGNSDRQERLVNTWTALWSSDGKRFTVPVSWVLQCIGLYDHAPVVAKLMIRRFIVIGIESSELSRKERVFGQERSFTQRMMDLIMLSDTPEADSLFDLFVQIYETSSKTDTTLRPEEAEATGSIVRLMMELAEELKVEIDRPTTQHKTNENNAGDLMTPVKSRQLKNTMKRKQRRAKRARVLKPEVDTTSTKPDTSDMNIKALLVLSQRTLNFLLTILTASDQQSLCPAANQRLRSNVVKSLCLYESLRILNLIVQKEDLKEDIQNTITACLENLRHQDTKLYDKAKLVLECR
ncbi:hypothetical protein DFQ28_000688 [Apophysomyces sp. BC1034]|nr:hypothetical protein DFQ29_008833 [Apophysomyces sp. BC1021]KAG0171609.1 hypothetical protein DFQ30_000707 [Apophysomyces sp. BC1015]KAG0191247.1 hypothetical protein DFQ28_000688 [Apophysomyces sp. BC1034]